MNFSFVAKPPSTSLYSKLGPLEIKPFLLNHLGVSSYGNHPGVNSIFSQIQVIHLKGNVLGEGTNMFQEHVWGGGPF